MTIGPGEPSTEKVSKFTKFHALVLSALYFSQGLPAGLVRKAMPALMRENMVPVEYIGLIKMLEVPWLLKVFWAPAVDRIGTRRRWILAMQGAVIPLFFALSWFEFGELFGKYVFPFFILLIAIYCCSATQDVATDGLAISLLPKRLLGLGNTIQESGYQVGMIFGGGLLLISVDLWGWRPTIQGLSLVILLCTFPIFFFKDKVKAITKRQRSPVPRQPFRNVVAYFKDNYHSFVTQPRIGWWIFLMMTYKLGSSLGAEMINPMLIDRGFTLLEVGSINSTASVASIFGSIIGGLVYYRWGAFKSMLSFGALQAIGILGYSLIAHGITDASLVYCVAIFEQVANGMSNVALFAMMMFHCRRGREGTDYTTQACLEITIGGAAAALSGFFVKFFGYKMLFLTSGAVGFMTLIPVVIFFGYIGGGPPSPRVPKEKSL